MDSWQIDIDYFSLPYAIVDRNVFEYILQLDSILCHLLLKYLIWLHAGFLVKREEQRKIFLIVKIFLLAQY